MQGGSDGDREEGKKTARKGVTKDKREVRRHRWLERREGELARKRSNMREPERKGMREAGTEEIERNGEKRKEKLN